MKTNIKESIKIIVGILLGTGLVMFLIWFMAGGVMLMPPFIVIPILMVLFVVSFIVAGVMKGYKLAIVVVVSFVFGWFGFNAYYKYTCGPNSTDVKVMKPMAQKISEYIIKNGIPKSLKDIPDLPYELVGCENTSYYDKFDAKISNYIKVYSKENADSKVITEECHFNYTSKKYSINFNGSYEFKYGGDLIMRIENDTSKTGLQYFFKVDTKGNIFIDYKGNPYSSNTSGFCFQLRQ